MNRSFNLASWSAACGKLILYYTAASKVQRRMLLYCVHIHLFHFGHILCETRAHAAEWAHKGVGITRVRPTHALKAFNCEPWQEETNFIRPAAEKANEARESQVLVAPPRPRIDIVTLEWSQVKQMGKVTNNKCSKDLANERESDRPVNSTSLTRSPHDVCAAHKVDSHTYIYIINIYAQQAGKSLAASCLCSA